MGNAINGLAAGDRLGFWVALSGDGLTLAVGADQWNNVNPTGPGYVRVFQLDDETSWLPKGQVISGNANGDRFGFRFDLSKDADVLAIGSFLNGNGGGDAGHVLVYQYNTIADNWDRMGRELLGEPGDQFGKSVSVASHHGSTTLAVGAHLSSEIGLARAGRVHVFPWNGQDWEQLGNSIVGEVAQDQSGEAVQLSSNGRRVAIGSRFHDGPGGSNSGSIRIFEYNWFSGEWNQLGDPFYGERDDDLFGWALAMSADGSIVAGGAYFNDGPSGSDDNAGHVQVYSS